MSDTTITAEERESWRERLMSKFSCFDAELSGFTLRLLNALEQAEADLARVKAAGIEAMRKAEQAEARAEKAEANVARLQQRVNELLSEELTDGAVCERIQLRFNIHEVLQQNERLTKMVDWLVERCAELCEEDEHYPDSREQRIAIWDKGARRAVADSGVKG